MAERRKTVRKGHSELSISAQCRTPSLHRSGPYHKAKGETELNLEPMRLIDEHYLYCPEKGAKRMNASLTRDKGCKVSKNRIERLYHRVMGLRAVLPGRHTSKRNKEHKVCPCLLNGLKIERPNQAWATDITYMPVEKGYMYLMAVIDLHSRFAVHWSVSNSMDADRCTKTLEEAIEIHGRPGTINTGQGSLFTSDGFTAAVSGQGNQIINGRLGKGYR